MVYYATNKSYCSFLCIHLTCVKTQNENQLEFEYVEAHSQAQIQRLPELRWEESVVIRLIIIMKWLLLHLVGLSNTLNKVI